MDIKSILDSYMFKHVRTWYQNIKVSLFYKKNMFIILFTLKLMENHQLKSFLISFSMKQNAIAFLALITMLLKFCLILKYASK